MAVDDADDDVLVGDVGADGQIADAAAVGDDHAIARPGVQAVDSDDQPACLAGGGIASREVELRSTERIAGGSEPVCGF